MKYNKILTPDAKAEFLKSSLEDLLETIEELKFPEDGQEISKLLKTIAHEIEQEESPLDPPTIKELILVMTLIVSVAIPTFILNLYWGGPLICAIGFFYIWYKSKQSKKSL